MLQNASYMFFFLKKETKQNKRLQKKKTSLFRQESNPRPSTWKGNALSIVSRRPYVKLILLTFLWPQD